MDPNGSPLQVINSDIEETTMALIRPRVAFDTTAGTRSEYYGLAAYLPTCTETIDVWAGDNSVLVQEHDCSRDQARNEDLGLNPTEGMEVMPVLVSNSITRWPSRGHGDIPLYQGVDNLWGLNH